MRNKKIKENLIFKIISYFLVLNLAIFATFSSLRAENSSTVVSGADTVIQDQTASSTPTDIGQTATSTQTDFASTTPNSDTAAVSTATTTSGLDASASTAPAADPDCVVTTGQACASSTPSSSVATTTTDVNNATTVSNQNNAATYNNSYLNSLTGKNDASFNTGSGIITTQEATGDGQIVNVINANLNRLAPAPDTNISADPSTDNLINVNNQLTVKNVNNSDTTNSLEAYVSSGENTANYNTGHGIVSTGNANMGANFLTLGNTNFTNSGQFYANWQNIYNDWTGDLNLGQETGTYSPLSKTLIDASHNSCASGTESIINVNNQETISNQNSGNIKNEINADVVSGKNKTNYNTGSGTVITGKVNSAVNVLNFLNSNINSSNWWLKSLNVFGNWTGNIILPKMTNPNLTEASSTIDVSSGDTGANSTTTSETNVTNSLNIKNQNQAVITENVNAQTNTGDNKASDNGGSGVLAFGDAKVRTNELNVADLNVTGNSWWMVVVNKFGDWAGSTVGSPSDMFIDNLENTTVYTPYGSGVVVNNQHTPSATTSDTQVNVNNEADITSTNTAEISNKLNVNAVSGENESQYNTGHAYITTGDIRVMNNLVNFANTNINVGNWLLTVVNVFGNWTGNLIFDQTASSTATASTTGSTTNSSTDNSISNSNVSTTTNNASSSASSGENTANYNTGSGIITTGAAVSVNNVNNQTNINDNTVGNGTSSSTDATASGTASTTINNSITNNNTASTTNNASAQSSTGSNSSNYNTGSGVIDTGLADALLQLGNSSNMNKSQIEQAVNGLDDIASSTASSTSSGSDPSGSGSTQNGGGSGNSGDTGAGASVPPNADSGSGGGGGNSNSGGGSNLGSGGAQEGVSVAKDLKKLEGDLNGDGKVDDADFSILMANWGKKLTIPYTNGDGLFDDYILSIVMNNWGLTSAANS